MSDFFNNIGSFFVSVNAEFLKIVSAFSIKEIFILVAIISMGLLTIAIGFATTVKDAEPSFIKRIFIRFVATNTGLLTLALAAGSIYTRVYMLG